MGAISKEVMYNMILEEVLKLELKDGYNVIFLSTMVLRKIRHPEEDMREISRKVMKKMPERYGKQDLSLENPQEENMKKISRKALKKSEEEYGKENIVVITSDESLENLESALDEARLPKSLMYEPELVGVTVKKIAKTIIKKINKLVD